MLIVMDWDSYSQLFLYTNYFVQQADTFKYKK